jgi:hypothetical protein
LFNAPVSFFNALSLPGKYTYTRSSNGCSKKICRLSLWKVVKKYMKKHPINEVRPGLCILIRHMHWANVIDDDERKHLNDYINECVIIYENTLNKIKDSDINKIKNWVKNSEVDNQYKTIDNLFSSSVLMIESKIESRRLISETLKKSPTPPIETPLIPINSMVNIANKTISNYINNLDESNKKELLSLLSESDSKLSGEYDSIKENVLQKLTSIKESTTDTETTNKVNETINKISSEKYDKLNYIRLKNLNSSI